MKRRLAICLYAVWAMSALVLAGRAAPLAAADSSGRSWLTGPALNKQLAAAESVQWSAVPLRIALSNRGQQRRVAVLIDRRVDPDQPIDLAVSDAPLGEIFRRVAEEHGSATAVLGGVVYFGPPQAARQLRTLSALRHNDAGKLPAAVGRKLLASKSMSWPDLAQPRQLIQSLADDAGLEIAGLQRVPHDLWAAADLPPLPWVDRLTLVAVQFDLTFAATAEGVTLVPIPKDVAIARTYNVARGAVQTAEKWRAALPDAVIDVEGSTIVVRGRVEDHEFLTEARTGVARPAPRAGASSPASSNARPRKPSPDAETRYTLRNAKGTLEQFLQTVGKKVELRIDRAALEKAGISLVQPITVNVEDATLDELLQAILDPAGCTFRREGKAIVVEPGER